MHTLESCCNGRDNSGVEIDQTNNICHIRSCINLIRREIGLGQHINRIGSGVRDENRTGCGRDATRRRRCEYGVVHLVLSNVPELRSESAFLSPMLMPQA